MAPLSFAIPAETLDEGPSQEDGSFLGSELSRDMDGGFRVADLEGPGCGEPVHLKGADLRFGATLPKGALSVVGLMV